ncbi:nucleotidyltransferase family protein [Nocardioides campestrisoli]|uniref:nucleotidyltransferase family protein n=1 Tax=Nocardioides campestrisoli TaxID=2736757 RepID=UPI0015E70172|nr:nucleotidyltransferase family protein [Nocardioides campestrisoli]
MRVAGLVLAAGAGRRYGGPKALARDPDGTAWLVRAVDVLRAAGCDPVLVVLGAEAERAAALLAGRDDVTTVVAPAWEQGMGASLRTGLDALADGSEDPVGVLVHLVDLPDVTSAVVARVLSRASGPGDLARASYDGRPGHPVLLGRDHWHQVASSAHGAQGAREHLATHAHTLVECGDLAGGHDVDVPRPDQP